MHFDLLNVVRKGSRLACVSKYRCRTASNNLPVLRPFLFLNDAIKTQEGGASSWALVICKPQVKRF
jgi:hypothetical protein